jgi:hypothetical protein
MKDIMIDIETLDTKETAVIVSIGAVFFDIKTKTLGKELYRTCTEDLEWQVDMYRRTVSMDTLKWWLNQSSEARNIFQPNSIGSQAFSLCLIDLREFIHLSKGVNVWANSPSFDLRILKDAFNSCAEAPPFKYYQERDFRTIAAVHNIKLDSNHNALDDAKAQAIALMEVL